MTGHGGLGIDFHEVSLWWRCQTHSVRGRVQYGGFAVEGVVNMKARNFAAHLKADGVAFEEGTYATAGYDAVRFSSIIPPLVPLAHCSTPCAPCLVAASNTTMLASLVFLRYRNVCILGVLRRN